MILLCFDGSADACSAIDRAGDLFNGRAATILTVWEPFIDVMTRSGTSFGMGGAPLDYADIDRGIEQAAREHAQTGVERARSAGLNPEPRVRARGVTIADSILAEADDVGADAIVVGSRGLTGLKSLLLGSVSHALLQHADRAVMVVPSSEVAAERAEHRDAARLAHRA